MEWISAIDAVHLISPHVGGDSRAKEAITERLRDGGIRSTCWWHAHGLDIGKPYVEPRLSIEWDESAPAPILDDDYWYLRRQKESAPTISRTKVGDGFAFDVKTGGELAQGFWRSADRSDIERWDWSTGFFLTTSEGATPSKQPAHRFFALGVSFEKSNILNIVGQNDRNTTKINLRSGRLRSPEWGYWVAEVLMLHEEVGIANMSTTALRDTIATRLSEKGLPGQADSSAYDIAAIILEALGTANRKSD